MKNAGWLFYRGYYQPLEGNDAPNLLENFLEKGKFLGSSEEDKKKEKALFGAVSNELTSFVFDNQITSLYVPGTEHFSLTTTYPGLLTGSGYSHQTGTLGEFKLGFFFDHSTGLPVIPGSSVKGILRSAFPENEKQEGKKAAKENLIKVLLKTIKPGLENINVLELERQIFEGHDPARGIQPMPEHDIFLDAFIEQSRNKGNQIFDEDYITPHGDNPLKDPVPVRFLKILPGVTFRFNFRLKKTMIGDEIIEAEDKKKLFELIFKKFGAGAKTNVGYGQFE